MSSSRSSMAQQISLICRSVSSPQRLSKFRSTLFRTLRALCSPHFDCAQISSATLMFLRTSGFARSRVITLSSPFATMVLILARSFRIALALSNASIVCGFLLGMLHLIFTQGCLMPLRAHFKVRESVLVLHLLDSIWYNSADRDRHGHRSVVSLAIRVDHQSRPVAEARHCR